MTRTKSITSIGRIAAQLQQPVESIIAIVAQHSIAAEIRINGVPHYCDRAVQRIARHLNQECLPESTSRTDFELPTGSNQ